LAEVRAARTDLAASLEAAALVAALLGGRPLFVSRLFGLL
jgi:hypothetical protein